MTKKPAAAAPDRTKKPEEGLLTLPELAAYLHLDEKTVYKLVSTGKLPSVGGERQWQFRKKDVDVWLERELLGEEEHFTEVPDGMKLPLEDLLPDSAIIIDLKARTSVAVIEELAARAYANGWLTDKPWFVGQVVERESLPDCLEITAWTLDENGEFDEIMGLRHKSVSSPGHRIWVEGCEPICAGLISGAALMGIGNSIVNVIMN